MDIELHIEELVLHGFAARDRRQIAEALQQELLRLMSAEGAGNLPQTALLLERVNAGAIQIQAGQKPQLAGRQIARAVYRGMRQQARVAAIRAPGQPGNGGRQA